MREVIPYAPYVFACKTIQKSGDELIHLFTMIPIARTRFIQLRDGRFGIKKGFKAKNDSRLGIHLEVKNTATAFGDKLAVGEDYYWGGCFSLKFPAATIPSDYVFTIHLHKGNTKKPHSQIGLVYSEIEEIGLAEFYQMKDGGFALDCPYIYVDQEKPNSAKPKFLIPNIQKYQLKINPVDGTTLPAEVFDSGNFSVAKEDGEMVEDDFYYEGAGTFGSGAYSDPVGGAVRRTRRRPRMRIRSTRP